VVVAVSRCSGFTIVEIIVSLASALLILAAAGSFARSQSRAFERESRHFALRETVRRVLATISRELRGAGFAPVFGGFDGASGGLTVAETERIEVRADLHGTATSDPPDGDVDDNSDERIGFSLSRSRGLVSETIGRQSQPLTLEGMVPPNGLAFTYFDACDEEIPVPSGGGLDDANRARVRRIAVHFVARQAGGDAIAADTTATLRNREDLRCE
jgi:type II secretory pathway pseudopilin PulG